MQKSSPVSGPQTEALHHHILAHPGMAEHPNGSSKYVRRYQHVSGLEIAVENRLGAPRLYVTCTSLPLPPSGLKVTKKLAGNGRNSNLNNKLPTFKDSSLWRLEVETLADADRLLEQLI